MNPHRNHGPAAARRPAGPGRCVRRFGRIGAAAVLLVWVTLPLGARPARAVTYLEQAERLQLINAYLLDLRPAGAPLLPERSVIELQLEAIPQPSIDTRVGSKKEPVDSPPVTPRVRAKYIAAWGLMAGITASPPIPVMGFSAPWVGGELGWRFRLAPLHGELRGYALTARITGPITEKGAKDEFDMTNTGADVRLGLALGPLMPYAGVGTGHTDSTLTIDSDGAQLDASADYQYWMAGITYHRAPLLFTFEQNRTEDFLSHYILAVAVRF